jgi:integrase
MDSIIDLRMALCLSKLSELQLATLLKPHGVTVHSLRKTYAYTLKSSQIHVTTAAKMMGHSNPLVTLKIYTLVLDDVIAKSAIAMEAFIVKSSLDNQAKKFAS